MICCVVAAEKAPIADSWETLDDEEPAAAPNISVPASSSSSSSSSFSVLDAAATLYRLHQELLDRFYFAKYLNVTLDCWHYFFLILFLRRAALLEGSAEASTMELRRDKSDAWVKKVFNEDRVSFLVNDLSKCGHYHRVTYAIVFGRLRIPDA